MILTDRRRVILFCYVFFLPLLSVLLRGTPLPSYILAESETFRPYLLIGETGKNFDGTEEAIIQKFFMNDAEIIGRYRPVGDPDRYIFFVTTKQLKKASRNGGEHGLFLGVLHLAVDVKGEMVYLSVPNIDYWGNLLLREDFDRVTKAVGEFKTDLPRMLPKLRGRFMRPFGSTEPLTVDRLRTYQFMKRLPSMDDTIELGNFESHDKAIRVVEERLKKSTELTKLFRYDVMRIAELLDRSERKATPFYPWQIAVVNGRVFSPAPLFKIPAGFPELTLRQLLKLRKLSTSIMASLKELEQ